MTEGLLWAGAILLAMGWFAIGWVARGEENRRYAESRLRHLATQAVERYEPVPARWDVERFPAPVAPAVVHVHLGSLAAPQPQPVYLPVIDGQVVHELPRGGF